MIAFPNCKINLGLSVEEKRIDGFHNIETIMYPLEMYDALEIIISRDNKFSFSTSGLELPGDMLDNLVVKAYNLLHEEYKLSPVKIHLHKAIPSGAGLGGGSADAAFTIKILNRLFELQLSDIKIQEYAGKLGSDCAFFIQNKPVLAFDKGDRFNDIQLNLKDYYFVIVKPDIQINTALAYSWVQANKKEISIKDIAIRSVDTWKKELINDFEKEVFNRHPEIEMIKETMYKEGAVYVSMTGSGAAVYGIFYKTVSPLLKFKDCFVWKSAYIN